MAQYSHLPQSRGKGDIMEKLQRGRRASTPQAPARYSSTNAIRLTPAQIRAQSHAELLAKSPLRPDQASKPLSKEHATPPPSPKKKPDSDQTQLARTGSQSQQLPKPPVSPILAPARPSATRQNSNEIAQPLVSKYHQSVRPATNRGIVENLAPSSFRTSSTSKSVTAPTKYRGNDVTRTGSLSMFQTPQSNIILNPLSHFSRPRTKYLSSSFFSRHAGSTMKHQAQQREDDRTDSSASSLAMRSDSAILSTDSSMSSGSVGSRASKRFVIVKEDSMPKEEGKDQVVVESPSSMYSSMPQADIPLSNRDTRKTASVTFDMAVEKDSRRKRRHTFSWKRTPASDLKSGSKDVSKAPKTEISAADVDKPVIERAAQQVVEQTDTPTSQDKGKAKEVTPDHAPQTAGVKCCDKCGKIKKLRDARALMTDGQAAEALGVAGPSASKVSTGSGGISISSMVNPTSAANAAQLGLNRQRQPQPDAPVVSASPSVVKDCAAPITPAIGSGPAQEASLVVQNTVAEDAMQSSVRLTRFASLRGRSQEKESTVSAPALSIEVGPEKLQKPCRNADLSPINEPPPEVIYNPADNRDHFIQAPTRRRRYSLASRRPSMHVAQLAKQPDTQKSAPLDLAVPIMLPEPNLGMRFARSNVTLRGLVLPRGGSSANLGLMADAMKSATVADTNEIERGFEQAKRMDQARQRYHSRVREIMAI